jgi:hypothetical protein
VANDGNGFGGTSGWGAGGGGFGGGGPDAFGPRSPLEELASAMAERKRERRRRGAEFVEDRAGFSSGFLGAAAISGSVGSSLAYGGGVAPGQRRMAAPLDAAPMMRSLGSQSALPSGQPGRVSRVEALYAAVDEERPRVGRLARYLHGDDPDFLPPPVVTPSEEVLRAAEVEERADEAERRARDAEDRCAVAEAQALAAEARADQAEARTAAVRARLVQLEERIAELEEQARQAAAEEAAAAAAAKKAAAKEARARRKAAAAAPAAAQDEQAAEPGPPPRRPRSRSRKPSEERIAPPEPAAKPEPKRRSLRLRVPPTTGIASPRASEPTPAPEPVPAPAPEPAPVITPRPAPVGGLLGRRLRQPPANGAAES